MARAVVGADSALLLGLIGACATPGTAAAQDYSGQSTPVSVQKRPRPDFDPVPIRFGAFDLTPSTEARITYDDNIYAADKDRVDDALLTFGGGVAAASNWSHHALNLSADGAITRGLSQTDEDTSTYSVQANGRYDLGVDTDLTASVGQSRAYEPRGSIGDTTLRGKRIAYDTLSVSAGARHTAGRLLVEAEGTLDRYSYESYRTAGGTVAQPDRDFRSWAGTLRAGYAFAPGIAAVVEGGWNASSYPDETTGLDRSSSGWSLRGGVQFGVTRLIQGRAAVGWQDQRYNDPAFPRISGLDFNAALEWNPTRLVTWSLQARRSIQRSPIVGVAGIRQSRYGGRVDYELRRNVILSGSLDYTVSEFSGTARVQKDLTGSAGIDWLMSRNLRLGARGNMQRTRSDGPAGRDFERQRFALSLRYTL